MIRIVWVLYNIMKYFLPFLTIFSISYEIFLTWKVLIWCWNGVATAMFDKGLSLFAWFLYLFKLDSSTIEAFKKLRELTFVLEYILIISRQFDFREKILKAKNIIQNILWKIIALWFFFFKMSRSIERWQTSGDWRKSKDFFAYSELTHSRRFKQEQ